MKKPVRSSKLYAEFSKLGPGEQDRALEFIIGLVSSRNIGGEELAGTETEVPDMLDLIDELGIEIARLNFLYDFTSFIEPNNFRFTGSGASGLNLFIEERLEALRRISNGIYSGYKKLRSIGIDKV